MLAAGEHLAEKGDVVVHRNIIHRFEGSFELGEDRADSATGESFIVVTGLIDNVPPQPWIELRKDVLTGEQCRPWMLPAVYEQARSGARGYLSEFR